MEIVSAVANERLLARLETGRLNLFRESIEVRTSYSLKTRLETTPRNLRTRVTALIEKRIVMLVEGDGVSVLGKGDKAVCLPVTT